MLKKEEKRMRKFEIISEKQWAKDISVLDNPQCSLIDHLKPRRGTKCSAGYDFISPIKIVIPAHGMAKIPTGIKVAMEDDEILSIYPRSSIGLKKKKKISNTEGIVDAKK